jgi:hypothetical protein
MTTTSEIDHVKKDCYPIGNDQTKGTKNATKYKAYEQQQQEMQRKMIKPLVFGATGVEGLPRSAITFSFTAPSMVTRIWVLLPKATSVEGLPRSAITSSFTTPSTGTGIWVLLTA